MKRFLLASALATACALIPARAGDMPPKESEYWKVNKSLLIFGEMFRQVSNGYVDGVDPEEFVNAGIDGMLSYLDPYTTYIPSDESDDIETLTRGVYGGVGMTVGIVDSMLTVTDIAEGYPADNAGLRIGDRIWKVDSSVVLYLPTPSLRTYTRGTIGDSITLHVLREGVADTLALRMPRREIQLKAVEWYGMVDDSTGYIALSRFTWPAIAETRTAVTELMARPEGEPPQLILDLRGNPGGLLEAAVAILEFFVPEGTTVVSTKGRLPSSQKTFTTTKKPLLPNTRLVVLVDEGSASASEIVAGALQDLDRAVVMGKNTFGKGLVQTVSSLPYEAQMKMTTARYYTPSGRCIQRVQYDEKRSKVVKSSIDTTTYTTASGRPVASWAGVAPDVAVEPEAVNLSVSEIERGGHVFTFASRWRASLAQASPAAVAVDSALLDSFEAHLRRRNFSFRSREQQLIEMLEPMLASSTPGALTELAELKRKVSGDGARLTEGDKKMLMPKLRREMLRRVTTPTEVLRLSLRDDDAVQRAIALLHSAKEYQAILSGPTKK